MESYRSLEKNTEGQPDHAVALAKWRILNRLHDRNETLYYRVSPVISPKSFESVRTETVLSLLSGPY